MNFKTKKTHAKEKVFRVGGLTKSYRFLATVS